MSRKAAVDHPIHELLQQRWSPYSFDPERAVAPADLRALFEAARWTMSSYNEQPWRYIVGVRAHDPGTWEKIFNVLVAGNREWAKNAPVLVLGLVKHDFERNGKVNKAAVHDLGAASAYLVLEATARGLSVHQMIGIEPDKAREVFGIEGSLEPFTGMAIGYRGDGSGLDEKFLERDQKVKSRKSLDEILIAGGC